MSEAGSEVDQTGAGGAGQRAWWQELLPSKLLTDVEQEVVMAALPRLSYKTTQN